VDDITPPDLAALAPFARQELARRNLLDFWAHTMPAYDFSEPIHAFVADKLDRASAREPGFDRICIVLQPGVGKSTMLRGYFASELSRKPGMKAAFVSSVDRLALRNSEDTMDLVRSDLYPWAPMTLDVEGKTHWLMANGSKGSKGSEVWSIPFGAVIVGMRFDFMLLDDIQADESTPELLDALERRLRKDIETRLDDNGSVVLLQNRQGVNDIVARLQNGEDAAHWKFYNIPAIAGEEDDVLGRAPGETLSKRWSIEKLERKKQTLGPIDFRCQYIGDPIDEKSQMFQSAWFERRYDVRPDNSTFTMRTFGLDTAWKTGPQNDSSCCFYVGIDRDQNIFLLDAWNEKLLYPHLKTRVKDYYGAHKPSIVGIEDSSAGSGLIEEFIAQTRLPIKRLKSTDSKESRAATLSTYFANGKVFLPRSAPWVAPMIEQFLHFGARGNTHDDFVDALELACRCLAKPRKLYVGSCWGGPDDDRPDYSRPGPWMNR
jgi:predicted phage terminase large subunit-like protein